MKPNLHYEVALTRIPGVGTLLTKQLLSYCGTAEQVFKTPKGKLKKIPGIGDALSSEIIQQKVLYEAEEEILRAEKLGVKLLFYTDPEYPHRLKQIEDAPPLLYWKGNADLQAPKIVGVVGTRSATSYGREMTEQLIKELKPYGVLVLSGLAYGIDICAHKTALQEGLSTIGVLGSGVDMIYPGAHKDTAKKMESQGGLLSEYGFGITPDAFHFPSRNRIIAGLCDALVVVEAAETGGALITAQLADGYNKEVLAVPGDVASPYSKGCHALIKTHRAHLYSGVEDIAYLMNWKLNQGSEEAQSGKLDELLQFTGEERIIATVLINTQEGEHLEDLSLKTQIPVNKLVNVLLEMEFEGKIKPLPGHKYKLAGRMAY